MKKQNKYRYLYVLQGWYGDSWSDLVEYIEKYATIEQYQNLTVALYSKGSI